MLFVFLLDCITGLGCYSMVFTCKIFSADADVRLARRIRRDTVEKGRDIGMVLDQVSNFKFSFLQYERDLLGFFCTLISKSSDGSRV